VSAAYGLPQVEVVDLHEPLEHCDVSALPPELLVCALCEELPNEVFEEDPKESNEDDPPLVTEYPKDVECLGWQEVV
jgi:hypothetical protein